MNKWRQWRANKKWSVPIMLLLINAVLFLLFSAYFNSKKRQENFLHLSGQEKYIDRSGDILNWGYALFKIIKDNVNPNKR